MVVVPVKRVIGVEDGGAGAELLKLARAGDAVGKGEGIGVVDDKDAVVDDVTGDGPGGVAAAELESAGGDGGDAGVGIVGGEDGGAGAELAELTDAGDGI